MKKILFLLVLTISIYGQATSTLVNQAKLNDSTSALRTDLATKIALSDSTTELKDSLANRLLRMTVLEDSSASYNTRVNVLEDSSAAYNTKFNTLQIEKWADNDTGITFSGKFRIDSLFTNAVIDVVDTSEIVNGSIMPNKLATQTKTVTSLTAPTPDYIGQPGLDAGGNKYIAIALSGTMWQAESNTIFNPSISGYFENVPVRSAVKSIKLESVTDGYLYALQYIYRNHASVKDQIVLYVYDLATMTPQQIAWSTEQGILSGVKTVTFTKETAFGAGASLAPDITLTIDYDKITDGSQVGSGTTRMFINQNLYTEFTQSTIDVLETSTGTVKRYIPQNPSKTNVAVANGGVKTSVTKLTIPAGQTGQNSVLYVYPKWTDQLFVDFDGLDIVIIVKFKVTNWVNETWTFTAYNGGITTKNGTWTYDSETETVTATVTIPCSSSYTVDTAQFYFFKNGTTTSASERTIEFTDIMFDVATVAPQIVSLETEELYKTKKQIEKEFVTLGISNIASDITALQTADTKFVRQIPTIPTITYSPAGGAVAVTNGLHIPAGQTGSDAYFNMNPKFSSDSVFSDFEGKSIKLTWVFKLSTTELSTAAKFDSYLYGGGLVSSGSITETFDLTNKIMRVSHTFVCSATYTSTYYTQIKNTTPLASDFTLTFVGLYIEPQEDSQQMLLEGEELYKTKKQILNVLDDEAGQTIIQSAIGTAIDIVTTDVTVKRYGTSGIDADFCGLNAIGDALASITDASYYNRYKILVDGEFLFTDPSDFTYSDPDFDEPTVIIGKDWVDVEGLGWERTVVAVKLVAGATFPGGKVYSDYQPVMWNCNAKLSNMKIIGKNCRYAIHFEGANYVTNETLTIDNCFVIHEGNPDYGSSTGTAFGTGMRDGQVWDIKNCKIKAGGAFSVHSALNSVVRGGEINFINCDIDGAITLSSYSIERIMNVNLIGTRFSSIKPIINNLHYYNTLSVFANYSDINVKSDNEPVYFVTNGANKGKGLRITSLSTGASSTVRFDETSTAFDLIVGDSTRLVDNKTNWLTTEQFGYEYKDGGGTLSGYAIGHIDIDEGNTAKTNGLGTLLGDCSSVNKTLTVIIDGTTYNIVFNENFTAQNNAYVLAFINTVISSVATADTYVVGKEYYPDFDGNKTLLNSEASAILSGMGIVFSATGMQKATNTDERIDGICLDNVPPGGYGRVITKGKIFSMYMTNERFKILDVSSVSVPINTQLGISTTQPGYFDRTASPKVLICKYQDYLEIK